MGRYVPPDHACSFPDEACSFCEGTLDPGPPCCHTPYLCGGPFEDCHPTADGYNEAPGPPDNCLTGLGPPECNYTACCAEAGDHVVIVGPGGTDAFADLRDRGQGQRDNVVHISDRRRCCIKDGCNRGCR